MREKLIRRLSFAVLRQGAGAAVVNPHFLLCRRLPEQDDPLLRQCLLRVAVEMEQQAAAVFGELEQEGVVVEEN